MSWGDSSGCCSSAAAARSTFGLTAWLDLADVARLAELTVPGGILVVDNWHWHRHSHLGPIMETPTRYHPQDEFRAALEQAGFTGWQSQQTANGAVSVWVGRRDTIDNDQGNDQG